MSFVRCTPFGAVSSSSAPIVMNGDNSKVNFASFDAKLVNWVSVQKCDGYCISNQALSAHHCRNHSRISSELEDGSSARAAGVAAKA